MLPYLEEPIVTMCLFSQKKTSTKEQPRNWVDADLPSLVTFLKKEAEEGRYKPQPGLPWGI